MVISVVSGSYMGLTRSGTSRLGISDTINTVAQRLLQQFSVVADCTTVFSVQFRVLLDMPYWSTKLYERSFTVPELTGTYYGWHLARVYSLKWQSVSIWYHYSVAMVTRPWLSRALPYWSTLDAGSQPVWYMGLIILSRFESYPSVFQYG